MKMRVAVAGVVFLGVCGLAHAQVLPATTPSVEEAATKPVTVEDLRKEARKEFAQELRDVPAGAAMTWGDLLKLEQREKLLILTSMLPGMEEEKRLVVEGEPQVSGKYFLARDPGEPAGTEPRRFNLLAQIFGEGQSDLIVKRAEIITLPATGNFDVVYNLGTMRETVYVQVLQRPTEDGEELPVRMLVQVSDRETDERVADLKVSGETFWDLRKRHPEETARYLRPALEMLGQVGPLFGTDAKMAWQVLGEEAGANSGELGNRIRALLPKLESEQFAEREAAQKDLKSIGQAGAMVLRSWDRSKLSAQQNAEIDAFLAEYLALDVKEVERFGKSADFLLDVMLLEEKTLREVAWERLKSIRPEVSGFVVDAGAEEWAKQVARLRHEIYRDGASDPALLAATRPSAK